MASSTDSCVIIETTSYNSDHSSISTDHNGDDHSTSWLQAATATTGTREDHNTGNEDQKFHQQQETIVQQQKDIKNQRITFILPAEIEKNESNATISIQSAPKRASSTIAYGGCDDEYPFEEEIVRRDPARSSIRFQEEYLGYEDPDINAQSSIHIDKKRKRSRIVDLFDGLYSEKECYFAIFSGIVLAFNSGLVDGACTSGMLNSSGDAHTVTGLTLFVSETAVRLANGEYEVVKLFLASIASFMVGAFFAGFLTPDATPYRIEPTYGPTFLVGGIFLLISSILAAFSDDRRYFFFFASASIGIQNGISSIYSANLIRPTGMTGSVTDVSVFLGQMAKGNYKNAWKFGILLSIIISFWMGSFVSFFATRQFQSYFLLFSAALMLCIGASLIAFLVVELRISVKAALLGTWQWKRALDTLHASIRSDVGMINNDGTESMEFSQTNDVDIFMTMFDRIDTDRSGAIDKQKLYVALKDAGMKVSRREVKAMMDHADKDKDGLISRQEWMYIAMACQAEGQGDMTIQQVGQ